ncbi:unnamed protein product [Polarella glacialis]|uniref:Vesicle transport protein n=1 Tax=Polarella glacialis TaxID=89957 RepID=A0A813HPT8_POLGL|nr:unnamed protein product [Polarella glacialis]
MEPTIVFLNFRYGVVMPGGPSSHWITPGFQDPIDSSSEKGFGSSFGSSFRNWLGGEDNNPVYGNEEETQGLLGYAAFAQKGLGVAQQSMKGVAERAGGAIGGQVGLAMQVATISKQQWLVFFVLMAIGALVMAASFASLPLLVLAPQKFAVVFTSGSVCILGALSSLKGFANFSKHLRSRERLPLSVGYLGSMAGTLWASLWYRSTLLTIGFSVAQMCGLLWFFVSYIPGGSYTMGLVCDFCQGACRTSCCSMCSSKGSLPL